MLFRSGGRSITIRKSNERRREAFPLRHTFQLVHDRLSFPHPDGALYAHVQNATSEYITVMVVLGINLLSSGWRLGPPRSTVRVSPISIGVTSFVASPS